MSASTIVAESPDAPLGLGGTFRAVSLPILAGLLARAIPVLTADFPLNDGGLFFAMTKDLQNANYALPITSSYNGLDIPFAYPPLGFYMAGLLSSAFGIGLLDVFRFLPLLITILTIPVVYLVAREVLTSRFQALLATWAYAFLPRAFDWLVAGGGITRSLGMLFATLAILEGVRYYKTSELRHGIGLAICAALTALSHPEAALFTGMSMVLILLAYGRTWRNLRNSIALAALAAALASPWWLTVISAHGIDPFLSGGQTGFDIESAFFHLVTFTFTDEPYANFLAIIGLIGFVHQVAKRRYLLPAWIVVVFVLDQRSAATGLMLPLAMLIAIAVDEVLLARIPRSAADSDPGPFWPSGVVRDRFARVFLVVALVFGISGSVRASTGIASPLHALPGSSRDVMAWIGANAPPSAEFLVVSGGWWFIDANSEWFPVLAEHRSLATLQGYEWLGKTAWDQQVTRYVQLQRCVWETAECLEEWTRDKGLTDAWLYVPKETIFTFSSTGDCCAPFRELIAASPDYAVVYTGPGGTVFRPRN